MELAAVGHWYWLLGSGINGCSLDQVPLQSNGPRGDAVGVPGEEGLHNSCLTALRVEENACRMGSDYDLCKRR